MRRTVTTTALVVLMGMAALAVSSGTSLAEERSAVSSRRPVADKSEIQDPTLVRLGNGTSSNPRGAAHTSGRPREMGGSAGTAPASPTIDGSVSQHLGTGPLPAWPGFPKAAERPASRQRLRCLATCLG